jgi:hypothetical protein
MPKAPPKPPRMRHCQQSNVTVYDKSNVTVDSITDELDEARTRALESEQISAAISATMGKAKLHGLVVDKSEIAAKVELSHAKAILLRGLIPDASSGRADQAD